ncbi:MAG: hypothetical protein C4523_08920 [Myxococcales bacterium]|nr:MAG: hypothetical protein C4523_08920 [Myxococcales bacterium]
MSRLNPFYALVCLFAFSFTGQATAQILYVDADATGAADGTSWCDAFVHLKDALAAAASSGGTITEIRVAQGTYRPDRDTANPTGTGDQSATFQLLNNVALRGGYAGCGQPNPDAHDIAGFETVLSIDADPMFVSAANGDFRLSYGSPCIDTGDNTAVAVETDLDDSLRIVDGNGDDIMVVDMRPYDYQLNSPIFIEAPTSLPSVEWAWLAWGDYDNDGDLDLSLLGVADDGPDNGRVSRIYRNDGNNVFTDINANLKRVFGTTAWADYDGDGDLDLALGGDSLAGHRGKIYRNDDGVFVDTFASVECFGCYWSWGDFDNDGDVDLANTNHLGETPNRIYRNQGQGTFVDIGEPLGNKSWSLSWGDFDNDADLDLAIAGMEETTVHMNAGGAFTTLTTGLSNIVESSLAWGDYDNDGDLDLALAGDADGTRVVSVFRNDEGVLVETAMNLVGVERCSLAWGDYDNDGYLDLVVCGSSDSGPSTHLYWNNGLGSLIDVGTAFVGVENCSLAWGDYNGDGRLDLVVSGMSDSGRVTHLYRNEGDGVNNPPTTPSELTTEVDGPDVAISWLAASDPETPVPGLSYNLRVGRSPGSDDVSSGMADPTSGMRRVPRIGNAQKQASWTLKGLEIGTYFASVQTIDTAFAGSTWSDEITFDIGGSEAGALYAIASGSHAGDLYRVSRLDATAILIGNTGVPFQSLAYDPYTNRLLAVKDNTGELMAIDSANANITTVLDEGGEPIVIEAATMTGLAVNPSQRAAYGVDELEILIRISLLTGNVESIGPVGFDRVLGLGIDPVNGTIYGYYEPDGGDFLITIDEETGQGTIVGPTGIGDGDGLTFDPTRGTLFTRDRDSDLLFEIDPLTANAAAVGPMPAFGVWGFAVAYPVVWCGDGDVDIDEECDDAGESATCDADCTTPLCGDGTINPTAGEVCDDTGAADGDGCSSACTVEPGYECTGDPSVCYRPCVLDSDCEDADVCTLDACQTDVCAFEPNKYGDVDGNGFITLADLFCVLDGFGGNFPNCSFEQDDIHGTGNPVACIPPAASPCCPNGVISLGDLFAVLDAFAGENPCCGG